ncbi:MAG TPA: DUF3891 family protein [Candidatus Acidoferrales bacterium]|jgi:hypothetical protein|nr:DUF3891 family protein [Candidatus Acidoferrales bacterium]
MLRLETETGWWLVTHPDHARLAGAFAERWGNDRFLSPEPREHVLRGITRHDDGWAARDAVPQITRQGKPSAFSTELVGKYSGFEEIDLPDYLAVRERAVRLIAEEDPYAAVLISMHTYSLLHEHADRSTIRTDQLPLLDEFLEGQLALQGSLREKIAANPKLKAEHKSRAAILDHFRLLQANDYLSLLTCVDYRNPVSLLHSLPTRDGQGAAVTASSVGPRHFVLEPYPFAESSITIQFPARHAKGKHFSSAKELQNAFHEARVEMLSVTVSRN